MRIKPGYLRLTRMAQSRDKVEGMVKIKSVFLVWDVIKHRLPGKEWTNMHLCKLSDKHECALFNA